MTMTEDAPVTAGPTPAPAEPQDKKGKKGKKDKKDKDGKGKSNLVPAIVLAAGLAAGGYFMGGGGGEAVAAGEVAEVEDAAPEPGATVGLEPITVNLDGGRFLRVGVAFRMSAEFEAVDDHGEYHFDGADQGRLRDQLIAMFAGRSSSSLVGAGQLDEIKAELLERANTLFEGEVLEVYLTDFVMQ